MAVLKGRLKGLCWCWRFPEGVLQFEPDVRSPDKENDANLV